MKTRVWGWMGWGLSACMLKFCTLLSRGGKGKGNIGVMSHSMFSMHKPSGDILMFYVVK